MAIDVVPVNDLGSLAVATPPPRRYFNRFEHDEPRRKGADFSEEYECARLISHGKVVATGLDAVNSFAVIRKKRMLSEYLGGCADGSC